MLTEIYMLFIIDLMIPHNGMNSIDVEFVACFVCCVVNIVQHIIGLTIPYEIRKPACSEVHLSLLSTSLHHSLGQGRSLRAYQRIMRF